MPSVVGRDFIRGTRQASLGPSDQSLDKPQPPLEKEIGAGETLIDLPAPKAVKVKPVDVSQAINVRASLRTYFPKPLTLTELSYLLWSVQGVKEVTRTPATIRTVPSAGARHPLETYVLANRVEGLKPGLYRFVATRHKLVAVDLSTDVAGKVVGACLGQDLVASSAATFIWVAVPYRSYWRYNERGYRYIFLDAGHACENLYLASQAVDGGCCAIGAFDDDAMNALLGLDGDEEFVIYLAAVGKKQ